MCVSWAMYNLVISEARVVSLAFLLILFQMRCFALKSRSIVKCPERWGGMILSRSAWLIFIFGGAYAAPTVSAGVVLSFIAINSMLYEVGCGVSVIFDWDVLVGYYEYPSSGLVGNSGAPYFRFML